MNRRIAIASCEDLPVGTSDDALMVAACERLDLEVAVIPWSEPGVDWAGFGATIIRSTWDYTIRRTEFLDWLGSVPRLHNPAEVVAANSDKTYLRDLAAAGLPVVPTVFLEAADDIELPDTGEFVVKPSVGAGSKGAGRFDSSEPGTSSRAQAHALSLRAAGRTIMVQPYLSAVDQLGETALIFFNGVFSHSIRKGAMLAAGTQHSVGDLSLGISGDISPRTPSDEEIDVAEQVLKHLSKPLDGPLLYARIDLLPSTAGPVLIEAELIEPCLFLDHSDGAADRLASAVAARLG
jgi:glutathione synthase/RimK-type ligase-like ATP-grasp enzyme